MIDFFFKLINFYSIFNQLGDLISVIDMPESSKSIWWRGKRGFEVS